MADHQTKVADFLRLVGIVAIQPDVPDLRGKTTAQEEFLPGTEAREIQDAMALRGWSYRFVCRVTNDLILIERQYDDFGLVMCEWTATSIPAVLQPARQGLNGPSPT